MVHRLVQRVVRERRLDTSAPDTLITTAHGLEAAAAQASQQWQDRALLAEYTRHAQSLLSYATRDSDQAPIVTMLGRLLYWLDHAYSHSTSDDSIRRAGISTARTLCADRAADEAQVPPVFRRRALSATDQCVAMFGATRSTTRQPASDCIHPAGLTADRLR